MVSRFGRDFFIFMTTKAQIKPEKAKLVKDLVEKIKSAKSTVFVDYSGMDVKSQQDLKKRLKEAGSSMLIVKNTLIKIAGKEAKVNPEALEDSILSGQTAIIFSDEDPVSPIQTLGKFIEETEMPSLKVGIVEGNFQDKDSLVRISKLPSKEILLGQVMGAISAPIYGLVGTLEANLQKLIWVLKAKT
jgi:large subunit ribosomal protein L10